MSSGVAKRSIVINGHKTSISLEGPFWVALKGIAEEQKITMSTMVGAIDKEHASNLSSRLRLFVLDHAQHSEKVTVPLAVLPVAA